MHDEDTPHPHEDDQPDQATVSDPVGDQVDPTGDLDAGDSAPPEETDDDQEAGLRRRLREKTEVVAEDVGPLRKKLTITVPREVLDEEIERHFGELQREAVIPGFRKGRAPRRLLEKRFGSEIAETLSQQLVGAAYHAAIDKLKLMVIGDPMLWATPKGETEPKLVEVAEAAEMIRIPAEGPLVLTGEVEVSPEFALPDLEKIPVSRPRIEVTDEMVDRQIELIRRRHGEFREVTEGTVERDDLLTVSLRMVCDGRIVKEEDVQVFAASTTTLVEDLTVENFEEIICGARVGEERCLTRPLPEDYPMPELRGKEAELHLTIKSIRRLIPATINPEFLAKMGFESEEELRNWTRYGIEAQRDQLAREKMLGQIEDYLLSRTQFELPERLSERLVNRALVHHIMKYYMDGVPPAEVARHVDELKSTTRNEVLRGLRLTFIMEKIAGLSEYRVEVTEGELNGAIQEIAQKQGQRFDRMRDQLVHSGQISKLYIALRDRKILEKLLERAEIVEAESPAADAGAAPEGT